MPYTTRYAPQGYGGRSFWEGNQLVRMNPFAGNPFQPFHPLPAANPADVMQPGTLPPPVAPQPQPPPFLPATEETPGVSGPEIANQYSPPPVTGQTQPPPAWNPLQPYGSPDPAMVDPRLDPEQGQWPTLNYGGSISQQPDYSSQFFPGMVEAYGQPPESVVSQPSSGNAGTGPANYGTGDWRPTGIDVVDNAINRAASTPFTTTANAAFGFAPVIGPLNSLSATLGGPTFGGVLTSIVRYLTGYENGAAQLPSAEISPVAAAQSLPPIDFGATPEQAAAYAGAANPSDPGWVYDPNTGWQVTNDTGWDEPSGGGWDYGGWDNSGDYGATSYDSY